MAEAFIIPSKIFYNIEDKNVTLTHPGEDHENVVEILFNGEDSTAGTITTPALTVENIGEISETLKDIEGLLSVHSMFSKLNANHPSKFGLVPTLIVERISEAHRVGLPPKPEAAYSIQQRMGNLRVKPGSPVYSFIAKLSHELTKINYGWVSENANPEENGTLYIVPTLVKDISNSRIFGWELRQIGVTTPITNATWDDYDLIKSICRRTLVEDAETSLILRSLEDPKLVAEAMKLIDPVSAYEEAYKVFGSSQVSMKNINGLIQRSLSNRSVFDSEHANSYSITPVILPNNENLNYGEVCAAAEITLSSDMPIEQVKEAKKELALNFNNRDYGSFLINLDDPRKFWITRSPKTFLLLITPLNLVTKGKPDYVL